jgi:hypothetical protein
MYLRGCKRSWLKREIFLEIGDMGYMAERMVVRTGV